MNRIGLEALHQEMLGDSRIVSSAFKKAEQRFARREEAAYEGCAHHLSQLYNAIEQLCLRTAKAFENHIDDEQGWHTEPLNRLSIAIPGMRPALIPHALRAPLLELKNFRHVIVHAYDLELDPDKLALVLKYAGQVAGRFPDLVEDFITEVARQQNLDT